MPGDRRCLPKCLPPEHGACSTRDAVDRCHYRSQPRILSHKLQQVGDQPGICPDTGVYGHRVTNQASTSFPQSKRDGQTVCGMGQCGTCRTYVGQAPVDCQLVPMCTRVSSCPGGHPILWHYQSRGNAGLKTHAWLWSHQGQPMSPDVSHPGREVPAGSLKGHKLADYACRCEGKYQNLWSHPNHGHPALCNQCWLVADPHLRRSLLLHQQVWCARGPHC